jgi:hypothetical protein
MMDDRWVHSTTAALGALITKVRAAANELPVDCLAARGPVRDAYMVLAQAVGHLETIALESVIERRA